ncbi:chemotaxis protein MotB [Aliiroseovarius halocynthiae]|uniref:Peptidoglycan-binding protein n=1 Tax=Aliiroseovarius halocynthiae TaxID=985055 RepID=A0A545SYJ1_9RHOB|nr:peptidoglycan -binding protein [Aliiroseovarius halocynthiae]TQV70035.1 peptidoglycan -binding protein [Aliiroseovarius halocynthiae]SMR70705.1 chemotaxis protein MotB [Aliiroseovarius halocynthiae]
MALTRRSVQRMSGSIWPGFVDAMTALLLVLMFVLTIFMIVQFILRETISGQADELDALSAQVSELADALGLERNRTEALEGEVGTLSATLSEARSISDAQAALITQLTTQTEAQAAQITSFEAQVATLLSERDKALAEGVALSATVEDLENAQAKLISDQEALNLALAKARDEIDEGTEAARLAAAKREALEALVADLEVKVAEGQTALSNEEADRLAEAAAAEALRERLKNADNELTAMTLALEEERKQAEDTLTLLAAAKAAGADLDQRLATALLQLEEQTAGGTDASDLRDRLEAELSARLDAERVADETLTQSEERARLLAAANLALAEEEAQSAESQRQIALLNEQVSSLRAQLGSLQSILDAGSARDQAAQVQIQKLGSELNAALARVAAEERRRAELEEAERKRLQAEAKELSAYRSEFFGKLRDVLGNREGVQIVGDRFVFSSEVLFASARAELQPEGQAQVARVASLLSEIAGEIPDEVDWVIRVDGHTDNVPLSGRGAFRNNWELSQARALSVVEFMIDALGFPPERLAATGFGEYRPVNPEDSPDARAENRRIELKLTER